MKVIVYGLGKEYEKTKTIIKMRYEIVGLCDKEEKNVENFISINSINDVKFEAIYIASYKYFDEISNNLRKIVGENVPFFNRDDLIGREVNPSDRDEWVRKQLLSIESGKTILDAGAGEMIYAPYCKHLKYIAQDFCKYIPQESEIGFQMDKWEYSENMVVCDIVDMPFEDNSIDVVLCTEVFEHIKNPLAALAEFQRVLKKGGKLILTAPFSCLTHMAPYFYNCGFSEFWYKENLSDCGFVVNDISSYGDYFLWMKAEALRIWSVMEKYGKIKIGEGDEMLIYQFAMLMDKYSQNSKDSSEALCFGYRVLATKI